MNELTIFFKAQMSAFVGGMVDIAIMILMVEVFHCHFLVGIAVGGVMGAVVNFSINRHYTFLASQTPWEKQGLKFAAMVIGSILLKMCGTYILSECMSLDYKIARVVTDGIVCFGFNYFIQKFWVFRH